MTKRHIEALKHALMTFEWIKRKEAFRKKIGSDIDDTLEHVEVSIKRIKKELSHEPDTNCSVD